MRERVCKNCGGREYKVVGQNMVRCKFCGTLYVDEQASKEEEVLLVKASEHLRDCDFAGAISEYDDILTLFPMSFESYFGKALAKHKIVLYLNKNGTKKRPRFFGDIESISEDEDFKKALELAPSEMQKTYTDTANRIDRIKKAVESKAEDEKTFDLILCDNFAEEQKVKQAKEKLAKKYKVYDLNNLPMNERERDTYPALVSSKIFVLFANTDGNFGEYKHLFDRYAYFVSQRKKVRTSFVICMQNIKENKKKLPKYLNFASNFVDLGSVSFEQDLFDTVAAELEKAPLSTAKIEQVEIKKTAPKKKEYVDVENITPTELGSYSVENVEMKNDTKLKWIFLSLKNGDFQTAKNTIAEELKADPYSAELLFASLMAERQIKTQEEFFSSISNFKEKPVIDKILSFANREFAQNFVDKWENLVISLDSEEYYNAFLLYLAKFNTPNRENFIAKAEEKAIETENEMLIETVLKCFDNKDVSRYVDFYSKLAERYEKPEYYQKVLELDPGHSQSNISLLLSKFKTDDDKLSYQNRSEIEEIFKFLDENARAQCVSLVADMILPISFYDLEKAQKQLDFYLAYVDDKHIVDILHKISQDFLQMGFFKEAEKYLSIAISKENRAAFYWDLIKIKAHCKTDSEIIMSSVKIMDMPEWETLLELSPDEDNEKYAEIVSKNNMFKGKRKAFEPDILDKVQLKEKLESFLLRNRQILQNCEKENVALERGVDYYFSQLRPFEKYIEKLQNIKDFETYKTLLEKLKDRLDALDLSLDTSLNVLAMQTKAEGLKDVEMPKTEEIKEKIQKKIKNDRFLKGFLIIFLEIFPLAFAAMLFIVCTFMPKEVYLYFNHDFLVILLCFAVAIALGNFVSFYIKRKKWPKKLKFLTLFLFSLGAINLILFCTSTFVPHKIEINSVHDMQVLLKNAPQEEFVLTSDLDFENKSCSAGNFSGVFDGQNHQISNIAISSGLFKDNKGTVKDVTLILSPNSDAGNYFGAFAVSNHGKIENCIVSGNLDFECENLIFGGICALNYGEIANCQANLEVDVQTDNLAFGGICGQASEGKVEIYQNKFSGNINIWAQNLNVGGIVGKLLAISDDNINFSQNISRANIRVSGSGSALLGGLVGYGESKSENNFAAGSFDVRNFSGLGYAGGLYGQYVNSTQSRIQKSVSTTKFLTQNGSKLGIGALIGQLSGRIENSFGTGADRVYYGEIKNYGSAGNCKAGTNETYDPAFQFSGEIWNLEKEIPTLKWEE